MYKMSKIFFAAFIINYLLMCRINVRFSVFNYLFFALCIGCWLISPERNSRISSIHINEDIKPWIVFVLIEFVTGILISKNTGVFLNAFILIVEVIVMYHYINFVAKHDGNTSFFINVFALLSVMYASFMLFRGVTRGRASRLFLTETSNPNSDAIVLAFGIYSLYRRMKLKSSAEILVTLLISLMELYVIFVTGSRKSLILAVLFLAFGLIGIFGSWKKMNTMTQLFFIVILLSGAYFAIRFYLPLYYQSSAYLRMQTIDSGATDRWGIAKNALSVFFEHPLFGVGLNQFKYYSASGLYSHSTWPELLSCTGVVGTFLYSFPYFQAFIRLLNGQSVRDNRKLWVQTFLLLVALLSISTVLIIPYGMLLSLLSCIVFVDSAQISKNKYGR